MKKVLELFIDAVRGKEADFTAVSINRAIILLAVPMILEMAMESLFAVVDIYFVSQTGEASVTAVVLTESVLSIIYALGFGLGAGVTAIIARRIGEKDPEKAALSAGQAIWIGVIFSLLIGAPGFYYGGTVLELMGAEDEVLEVGTNYTRIMFGGNIVIMLLFLLNGVFRGAGNAAIAMRVLIVSNGLNIILDPCLIMGYGPFPEMGVVGAAVATNIGRGVAVCYQLYILFNGKGLIKLLRRHFIISAKIIIRILKLSGGATAQFLIGSASWVFLTRIMANYGTELVAGYGIAVRLIIFALLPAWGMANAAGTLVGQNLGANKPERAESAAWRASYFAAGYMFLASAFFFAFAPWILEFMNENPVVIASGVECVRIICVSYVFFAFGMVMSAAINGAGDTWTPTYINLVAFWVIQIPLAWILAEELKFEAIGVYSALVVAEILFAGIAIWVFKRGGWKNVEV